MGLETALIMSAVGSAVSAYGMMQAGKAQQRAYEYNAQIAERNAQIARDQAAYEAERQESRMRRVIAGQRVGYLASGVTLEGSAMELMVDTTVQGEMDRLAILYGGEVESVNQEAEAALSRMQGAAARKSAQFRAAGTLIGAAGSYSSGMAYGRAMNLIT